MTVSSEDLVNILLWDGPTNMRNFVCTTKEALVANMLEHYTPDI